jgi:hypothetical protein
MNRVYESATETAKKIRKTLKAAFPGVKFSVTSSTYSMGSSVYVSWTDGPMSSQVNAILNRFESGSFDGMQDMYTTSGYEWEGQIVVGAKYVSGSRQLSEERREQILTKLNELFAPGRYGDYSPYQWERAEKELIEAGELQGHSSQLPETHAAAEPDPEPVTEQPAVIERSEEPRGGNVIVFPVRDPEVAAKLKAEKLMNSLTPEQRLKLQILQSIAGTEITGMQLLMNPLSIDEMFKAAAEKIYS